MLAGNPVLVIFVNETEIRTIMRKSFNLFLILSIVGMTARAQVQYGIKGGFNFAELMTSGNPSTLVQGNSQHMRYFPNTSFNAGVFATIMFSKKWSLQPELVYSMQGASARPEGNYLVTATENYKLGYLNIPVLIKYKLPLAFFVETGPQLGLLLSGKADETLVGDYNTNHYNLKSQLKSTDLSWAFGAGYCSPINLGFDIRYNLGLNNINQASSGASGTAPVPNGTIKNSVIQVGVFYLFGKKLFNPPGAPEM